MIKLYGPGFSYYLRVVRLLCQFKGVAHEVTSAPFGDAVPFFGDGHAQLHPYRKLPVLIEDSLVLPETMAMAMYIESKPGPSFIPGDEKDQAKILSLAGMLSLYTHQFLMRNIVLEFAFPKGKDGEIRFDLVNANIPDAKKNLAWLTEVLGDARFLMKGQFTLCDAYLIPMLDYLDQLPAPYNLNGEYDDLSHYIEFHRNQEYAAGVLGKR